MDSLMTKKVSWPLERYSKTVPLDRKVIRSDWEEYASHRLMLSLEITTKAHDVAKTERMVQYHVKVYEEASTASSQGGDGRSWEDLDLIEFSRLETPAIRLTQYGETHFAFYFFWPLPPIQPITKRLFQFWFRSRTDVATFVREISRMCPIHQAKSRGTPSQLQANISDEVVTKRQPPEPASFAVPKPARQPQTRREPAPEFAESHTRTPSNPRHGITWDMLPTPVSKVNYNAFDGTPLPHLMLTQASSQSQGVENIIHAHSPHLQVPGVYQSLDQAIVPMDHRTLPRFEVPELVRPVAQYSMHDVHYDTPVKPSSPAQTSPSPTDRRAVDHGPAVSLSLNRSISDITGFDQSPDFVSETDGQRLSSSTIVSDSEALQELVPRDGFDKIIADIVNASWFPILIDKVEEEIRIADLIIDKSSRR